MAHDYFAILGLAPGRYSPAEIARSFDAERDRLIAQLDDPRQHSESRLRLEALHIAYAMLRDPEAQAEYLRTRFENGDDVTRMRRLVAASLEDGLLRYSRRQQILNEARRLGFSDFQTQLLIAQVQFGDERFAPATPSVNHLTKAGGTRGWARVAAVGVLALLLFLAMMRWLTS